MARRRTPRHELRVGVLMIVALLVFAWMSMRIGSLSGLGSSVEVTVVFDDAAGLVPDAAVKVAGVQVGTVRRLDVDFDKAVATLALRRSAEIRQDVRAQVRARSLLGEKYVALTPRTEDAPLMEDGGRIEFVAPSIEIDDLVAALGPVLATVDPDDVAAIVHNAAELSAQAGADAPALVEKASELLDKLNEAASIAPTLKEEVPALMSDLRRTVRELESTVERADALLVRVDTVMDSVDEAAKQAPDAVADARRLMAEIEPGMDDLRGALEQSDEAVADLRKVLDNFSDFDEEAIRRLLREDGVLVRLKPEKKKGGDANRRMP